jgi:hypothetical protein
MSDRFKGNATTSFKRMIEEDHGAVWNILFAALSRGEIDVLIFNKIAYGIGTNDIEQNAGRGRRFSSC